MAGVGNGSSWFQRFLLPGFAFKGVIIGGGYATGRELAEFFIGSGPRGGLLGLLLAMLIWSVVCALAFVLARAISAYDYRTFFQGLLGRYWIIFEIAYILFLVLILAVVAAAAGTIGASVLGMPMWVGTVALMAAIVGVTSFGTEAAERMFRYSSTALYVIYALFFVLALSHFGDRIGPRLALDVPTEGWFIGGVTYASYNVVAAVAILPFLQHLTSRRDAMIAGLLSGPLAMLPALLFFLCMIAYYPEIGNEALPSDRLLREIGLGWFQILFQLMIFLALLETGVGVVNGVNERVAASRSGAVLPKRARFAVSAVLVIGSGVIASRFGLVDLIASGYGAFGYIMLAIFVLPLLTIGVWQIHRRPASSHDGASAAR
ncbi:MAG: hypothetical protein LC648_00335 [Novosphingobium sp.]|nr:hypothetical protein [Novosphingobium sp.]